MTGRHQLDSLCNGKHPRPSLGKQGDSSMEKSSLKNCLGLFPPKQIHRGDSYSMLAAVLPSHELQRGENDPWEAPLRTKKKKKDLWFVSELTKTTYILLQHHPPWWCAPSLQENSFPPSNPHAAGQHHRGKMSHNTGYFRCVLGRTMCHHGPPWWGILASMSFPVKE